MHRKLKSNSTQTTKPGTKAKSGLTKARSTRIKNNNSRKHSTARGKSTRGVSITASPLPSATPPTPSQTISSPYITPHTIHSQAGFSTHVGFSSNHVVLNQSLLLPKSAGAFNPKLHQKSAFSTTSPFKSSQSFTSATRQIDPHQGSPVMVQNAHFFTAMTQKIKSVFGSSTTPTPPQPTTKTTTPEVNYQLSFKDLPDGNKKHIEHVMTRFRAHIANRPKGADTPITASDKAEFLATVSSEELESLQYDQGSQHFFHLDKPAKPLSTLDPNHTLSSKPTPSQPQKDSPKLTKLDKNSPEYEEMMKNNTKRYHEGELNAKMETRRAQMIKDSLESDVYHLDVDSIIAQQAQKVEELQTKYENNPDFDLKALQRELNGEESKPTELKLFQNKDGTITFENSKDGKNADGANVVNGKVQVPVDGTPTAIGHVIDPRLLISFICDMCNKRNVKSIPKNSYDKGVVLIRCECDADHLIADNLGWFDDGGSLTIDKIMKQDKGQDVFHASVLDTQKDVRMKMDMTLGPDDIGKEIGPNHITPEMLQKINETLAIAREQDERKKDQFKHFLQQDQAADALRKKFEELGTMPMLPGGKGAAADGDQKH